MGILVHNDFCWEDAQTRPNPKHGLSVLWAQTWPRIDLVLTSFWTSYWAVKNVQNRGALVEPAIAAASS